MGKSAIKLVLKRSKVNPVLPRPDKHGIKQPDYVRGATAVQVSRKLNWHKACIASKMAGKTFSNRLEVRSAFAKASKECATANPYK